MTHEGGRGARRSSWGIGSLVDQAPVAIPEIDGEGLCRSANRRWEELLRMHRGDALGLGWVHPVDPEVRQTLLASCRATASTCEQHAHVSVQDCGPRRAVAEVRLPVSRDAVGAPSACLAALTPNG